MVLNAKTFLRQAIKYDKMIANKMSEIAHLHEMATSITAPIAPETGVRVSSTGSKQSMANAIDKRIDLEKELVEDIEMLSKKKREITDVIEQLETTEYDILHKTYIQGIELADVADMMGRSYSWITTIHGRALKNVQDIINRKQLL